MDCILRIWLFSRCFLPPLLPRLVLLVLAVIMLASLVTLPSKTVSVYMLLARELSLLLSLLLLLLQIAIGVADVMDTDLSMKSEVLTLDMPEAVLFL